nr:uncharacterized protein C19orf44 homolog isoform X4 [Cavia porcellus]
MAIQFQPGFCRAQLHCTPSGRCGLRPPEWMDRVRTSSPGSPSDRLSRMASLREASFPGSGLFDLSSSSLDEPRMEDLGLLGFGSRPAQAATMASRFLKRERSAVAKHFSAPPGLRSAKLPAPTLGATGAQTRASVVLMKAAQMETKILGRAKARTTQGDAESEPETASEGPRRREEDVAGGGAASLTFQARTLEACTAESPAPGREGRRFLKTKGPAARDRAPQTPGNESAPKPRAPDSEAEKTPVLGSPAESSRAGPHSCVGLPSDKDQIWTRQIPPSVKPPPTWRPPLSGLHKVPQTHVPRDPTPHAALLPISSPLVQPVSSTEVHSQLASYPRRNIAGPGKEVASDTGDDDQDSDSLDDFRVNILSLDDLAAAVSDSNSGQKGAGALGEDSSGSSLTALAPTSPQPQSSGSPDVAISGPQDWGISPGSESKSESEVVEQLGSSVCSTKPESSSTAYSADFEPASWSSEAPDGMLNTVSCSTGTEPPTMSGQPQARLRARVTRREMAVQTLDATPASLWTEAIGLALGGTYVDPAPIVPHTVSTDALEGAGQGCLPLPQPRGGQEVHPGPQASPVEHSERCTGSRGVMSAGTDSGPHQRHLGHYGGEEPQVAVMTGPGDAGPHSQDPALEKGFIGRQNSKTQKEV